MHMQHDRGRWSQQQLAGPRCLQPARVQLRPKPSARISSALAALKLEFEAPIPTNPKIRWPTGVGERGSSDTNSVTSSSRLMPRLSASRRRRATTLSGSSRVTGTRTSYPPGPDGPRGHSRDHPSIKPLGMPCFQGEDRSSPVLGPIRPAIHEQDSKTEGVVSAEKSYTPIRRGDANWTEYRRGIAPPRRSWATG